MSFANDHEKGSGPIFLNFCAPKGRQISIERNPFSTYVIRLRESLSHQLDHNLPPAGGLPLGK